jgi:hypothetical protein
MNDNGFGEGENVSMTSRLILSRITSFRPPMPLTSGTI